MGAVNLLEACRKAWGRGATGRKLLHVSNDDVFGSLGPQGSLPGPASVRPFANPGGGRGSPPGTR